MKKIGFLVDFHGTVVDANQAWIDAFEHLGVDNLEEIIELVYKKTNRKIICKDRNIDYNLVKSTYRQFLKIRPEIIELIKSLSGDNEILIVSHSSRDRLMADVNKVANDHDLNISKVYSKEDGCKNDVSYIENILTEHGYDKAYLIGNDIREDFNDSSKIINLFVPYKKSIVYNDSL